MQHRHHCERFFIRRVGDYIIAHQLKPQRTCREVGTAVAAVRKGGKRLDRLIDFFPDAVRGGEIVGSDLFPDFFQIGVRLRVENKSAHERERRCLLLCRRLAKACSPSKGLTRPLLRSS